MFAFEFTFLMLFNSIETEHLWNVSYRLQTRLCWGSLQLFPLLLPLVLLAECGKFFSASDWLPIESSWFVDSIQVTLNRPQGQPYLSDSDSQFSKWPHSYRHEHKRFWWIFDRRCLSCFSIFVSVHQRCGNAMLWKLHLPVWQFSFRNIFNNSDNHLRSHIRSFSRW